MSYMKKIIIFAIVFLLFVAVIYIAKGGLFLNNVAGFACGKIKQGADLNFDSGKFKGRCRIWGGRASVCLHAQIANNCKCNASRPNAMAAKLILDSKHGCSNKVQLSGS